MTEAESCSVPGQASVRTGLTFITAEGAPSRFHGDGVRYKAKLIGMDHVRDSQGEKMCQDAMMKLKGLEAVARKQGKHKLRIWLKICSSGLKLVNERTGLVVYEHDRNRISSPIKDKSDPRALAYIYQYQDAYVLFYIKMANLCSIYFYQADPVLLDIKEICQTADQEKPDVSTETHNISLVVLNEASAAPPEGAALEDVFSPKPEPSSSSSSASLGQTNQVSLNNELMEVFSPQMEQPLSPSQMPCSQPESPLPTLSTAQILSMFPTQPVGGPPFTPPPYSPTAVPWGQQGLLGHQWAGPWPAVPGVPAWTPPMVTAPPAGGQPQGCSVASPQLGFMMGGGPAPNNPLESRPAPTGSAGHLGPPTSLLR